MRKSLLILFSICVVIAATAADIVAIGSATQVENGNDTLLFFRDEIHLKTAKYVDWYSTDGILVASNTNEIFPDDGGYYIKDGSYQSSPVYAFLYSDPAPDLQLTLMPDCGATTLNVKGDTSPFTYTRPNSSTGTYARACTLQYDTLGWHTDTVAGSAGEWVYAAARTKATLHEGNYILPPLYGPTPVSICYDTDIRYALGMDSACYSTYLDENDVRAVKMQLTSLVTTRGEAGDPSNEMNRPEKKDLITGSEYSGPLEVAFYSNPTPAAQYYQWTIYRSADVLVTRQDKDIRYTFSEAGAYRVVCKVNNPYCTSDSSEVAVVISASFLSVPNVFTPNGDTHNDEFRVAYRSLAEFHCWVYNRWGKLVYEWTDPAKGWDGTINGKPAAEGAYFYVIRAKGTDAPTDADYIALKAIYNKRKQSTPESVLGIYQLSGDINLLRGKK